jgi:PAS domain S-box-containing protein
MVVGLRNRKPRRSAERADPAVVSDALLHELANGAPVVLWMTGTDGGCIYCNARWIELTGKPLAAHLGDGWTKCIHPDDRASAREAFAEALRLRRDYDVEFRVRRFDGEWRWLRACGRPFEGPDGAFGGYVGACIDVTETRASDAARREVELRMRRVYEISPLGIAHVDASGAFLHSNPAFQRLLGYSEEELRRLTLADVTPAFALDGMRREFARFVAGEIAAISDEKPYLRKDGTVRWSQVEAVAVRDERERFVHAVALIQDVTERRTLEEQQFHKQKLETVGQLAGGVAHEFNNLLTAILGGAELARWLLPRGHSAIAHLGVIEEAADRAARLCQQLLAFGRRRQAEPRDVDVCALAKNLRGILGPLLGERVQVAFECEPRVWRTRVDPAHVEQVLINLAANARDAMPRGGRVEIRVRNARVGPEDGSRPAPVLPGEYVRIDVADHGAGMNEAVCARLFEPFFSTKEPGKGTGLGLATCHGLVQQAGGTIAYETELGRGTTFSVYLPRSRARSARGRTVSAR